MPFSLKVYASVYLILFRATPPFGVMEDFPGFSKVMDFQLGDRFKSSLG